jgi:hypothetical protein
MAIDLKLVIDATNSYVRVLTEAQECQRLHQLAGLTLPDPIKGLLRQSLSEALPGASRLARVTVKTDLLPPPRPSAPVGFVDGWISVSAKDASGTSLIVAIINSANGAISLQELSRRLAEVRPNAGANTAYTVVQKLIIRGEIKGSSDGMYLANREKAGLLYNGFIWAPPTCLLDSDIASYRREAIIHLLGGYGGLRMMNIVFLLEDTPWFHVEAKKDAVKADLAVLEKAGAVRKNEEYGTWELVK